MKRPKKSRGGRPPAPEGVATNIKIRRDLRDKLDTYRAEKKWSVRTAVETILETFFGKSS
jgi:hypothetical protein